MRGNRKPYNDGYLKAAMWLALLLAALLLTFCAAGAAIWLSR